MELQSHETAPRRERRLNASERFLERGRDRVGEWGFSVRGGSEHGIGIFVSWVDPGCSESRSASRGPDTESERGKL